MSKINITNTAITKLQEILSELKKEDSFLRVYVEGGGCSGMKYGMIIDDKIDEGDTIQQEHDFKIIVDKTSQQYTEGLKIDYSDDLVQQGFQLVNSNMAGGCGCGASFSTEPKGCETDTGCDR